MRTIVPIIVTASLILCGCPATAASSSSTLAQPSRQTETADQIDDPLVPIADAGNCALCHSALIGFLVRLPVEYLCALLPLG
jgi:hypothetical protein